MASMMRLENIISRNIGGAFHRLLKTGLKRLGELNNTCKKNTLMHKSI
jgi:hypothetical protein